MARTKMWISNTFDGDGSAKTYFTTRNVQTLSTRVDYIITRRCDKHLVVGISEK